MLSSCIENGTKEAEQSVMDDAIKRLVNMKVFSTNKTVDEPEPWELIYKDLLLLILDENNKIEYRIYELFEDDNTDGIVEEDYYVSLSQGLKKIICFSNLDLENVVFDKIHNYKTGDFFTDYEDVVISLASSNDYDYKSGVPMSGMTLFTVKDEDNQQAEVELVRLLAKFKLNFINVSGHKIIIDTLTFHGINNNDIYLLMKSRNQVILPGNRVNGDDDCHKISLTDMEFDYKDTIKNLDLYLNESKAGDQEYLYMTLDDKYEDKNNDNSIEGYNPRKRFAFLNLKELRRNDYVLADVYLTNYKIDIFITACEYTSDENNSISLMLNRNNEALVYSGDEIFIQPLLYDIYENNYVYDAKPEFEILYDDNDSVLKSPFVFDEENNVYKAELNRESEGRIKVRVKTKILDATGTEREISYYFTILKIPY